MLFIFFIFVCYNLGKVDDCMYYKETIDEVFKEVDSSPKGLSSNEVSKRLRSYGFNKIVDGKKTSKFTLFLKQFQDSMIIMLLLVSFISFIYSYLTSEPYTDTIIIVFIVLLNVFMGFLQEAKAEASIESLKRINNCKVKVKRDPHVILCDSTRLVPGDIILLEAGDKIPADGRVIEEYSSLVDESVLTGESMAVEKKTDAIQETVLINDRRNMVYSGCSVINGKLIVLVTATGMNTEIGLIAKSVTNDKDVPTPLQQKINEISRNLTIIVMFIIGIVFIYNIVVLHSPIIDVIMLCISLMVSAVPEGLPAVISISLSLGINEMAKKKALIRTLSSVETLGATEVICSDKTGTITKNEMTVEKVVFNGKIIDAKEQEEYENLFLENLVLCNNSEINKKKILGDPTETALVKFALNQKKDFLKVIKSSPRLLEIPFDSERKMMSTVNEVDGHTLLFSKGSLESLLDQSDFYYENGKIAKLTKAKRIAFKTMAATLEDRALRVLSFAYREIDESEYKGKEDQDLLVLEDKLIFLGMVGMIDPPREHVKESIAMCKEAGIIPVMITGDSFNTAKAIAKNIGLIEKENECIEGKELEKYSDSEMTNVVKKYRVYARVSPNDKVRIVRAWQRNQKVVAMTGDGVNDAPAIKLAHIGIGMGQTGTEVTKSVADVLLLDDCFNTIVDAVKEGRRIYTNIRNVILYSLSSNFAEIFIVVIGMFLGLNILLPIHILFIDLFTDAILSICLAFEKSSKNIMKEKPHKSSNKFFTPFMTAFLLISAVIESGLIYITYRMGLNTFGPVVAQSMAFLCLIVQEMFFAINCRNLKEPILKHGLFSNKYVNIGFIALIVLQFLVFVTPIRGVLHVVPLDFTAVGMIIGMNLIAFIIIEFLKPIVRRFFKD